MFAALGAPDGTESRILEVYPVAPFLREQETQVLILALSQIIAGHFISHFSIKNIVPINYICIFRCLIRGSLRFLIC